MRSSVTGSAQANTAAAESHDVDLQHDVERETSSTSDAAQPPPTLPTDLSELTSLLSELPTDLSRADRPEPPDRLHSLPTS